MLKEYLGRPLTSIPDPFEKYESFGHHNNAKLRSFLDAFNFKYEFVSSTLKYKSGEFDKIILEILNNYENILNIILPTLRNERKGELNQAGIGQSKIIDATDKLKSLVGVECIYAVSKVLDSDFIKTKCKITDNLFNQLRIQ